MQTIVKVKFGSHLYGTNTPASDLDYKSVHIPDAEDILLQRVKGSIGHKPNKAEGEKNNPGDIDNESYSLQEFLYLLAHGQTVAIDMLFAPEESLEITSPLWKYIQASKDHFLTNKSAAFVEYCRTQANKYGIKGSRVAAARDASLLFQKMYEQYGTTLKVGSVGLEGVLSDNSDHCRIVHKDNGENYFECCNRQVPFTASVKLAAEIFTKIHDNYGDRARLAEANEGVDWKALSHAVRVGYEALELMITGKITFPLIFKDNVLAIKQGKVPYDMVAKEIESLLEQVEEVSKVSVLRAEPDYELMDQIVKREYGKVIQDWIGYK